MPTPAHQDEYRSGAYFVDASRHSADAIVKAQMFVKLLRRNLAPGDIGAMADVGCGSGAATIAVAASLREAGFRMSEAVGYDVSPHVSGLQDAHVRFVHEDFTLGSRRFDLVILFDVVEHVPDPVGFLKQVSRRATYVGLHIPLDDSMNCSARNLYRANLKDPGHLIALDTVSALNLLAFAGLRVLDYEYVLGFREASERVSLQAKCVYPFRAVLAALSPWLLAKTLGGVSLMALCRVPDETSAG